MCLLGTVFFFFSCCGVGCENLITLFGFGNWGIWGCGVGFDLFWVKFQVGLQEYSRKLQRLLAITPTMNTIKGPLF